MGNYIDTYYEFLKGRTDADRLNDKGSAMESFMSSIINSPAYQPNSFINGTLCPIVATRLETKKAKVTMPKGSDLYIGDLVEVFGEHWLCVDLYIDEYNMKYGELWLCNQVFKYQDNNGRIIQKFAILDDGSYSNGSDKPIMVVDNSFDCYVSMDDDSKWLHIDKRLAVSVIQDCYGKDILEVGKIKWIDVKTKNFGKGSHLMIFGINDDAYSPENDNITEMICDYKQEIETEVTPPSNEMMGYIEINGRKTLRHGLQRAYTATVVSKNTSETITLNTELAWSIASDKTGITITPDRASCKVKINEDDDLIGTKFVIKCVAKSGNYQSAEYVVEVV